MCLIIHYFHYSPFALLCRTTTVNPPPRLNIPYKCGLDVQNLLCRCFLVNQNMLTTMFGHVIASARVLPIVYELIWTQNWSFNGCIFIPVLGLDLGVLELFTSTAEPVNISSIFSMGVLSGSKKKGSSGNWASVNIGGLFPFTQTIPQSLLLLFLLSLQYSWAA